VGPLVKIINWVKAILGKSSGWSCQIFNLNMAASKIIRVKFFALPLYSQVSTLPKIEIMGSRIHTPTWDAHVVAIIIHWSIKQLFLFSL
jgi:hypothetical protein